MNALIARLLSNRGYTQEFLTDIETHRHVMPLHVDEMCERLKVHRDANNKIVLLTDFDMDGIASGIVGMAGMAELGFNVGLYMPSTENYGFGPDDVDKIMYDFPDVKAIVTGDVGVTAFEGVDRAVELGLEVLVTDHHKPAGDVIAACDVCVNPMCDAVADANPDGFPSICGAHVMYLVLRRFAEIYSGNAAAMVPQIDRLRVFAGIGTVSDSMPVYYENRGLIRDAISICRMVYANRTRNVVDMIPGCNWYRRAFLGLWIMLNAFAEAGKIRSDSDIDEDFFGFYLAPAFNSLKRMHGDITEAYKVFFERESLAVNSMTYIFDMNAKRKQLVADARDAMFADEDAGLQPWAPYVYLTRSKGGIRGLLAQNVMSVTGEPALVIGLGPDGRTYSGSGRSPSWFPFIDLCSHIDGVHPAGHNPAFGISFDSAAAVEALIDFMKARIPERKPVDASAFDKPDILISTVRPDADSDIDIPLFEDFLVELEMYRPFGSGFARPDIALEFRPSEAAWQYIGHEKNHLKVFLPHGLTMLCFRQAHMLCDDGSGYPSIDGAPDVISVRGKLVFNEFCGNTSVEFIGQLGDDMNLAAPATDVDGVVRVPSAAVL